MPAQPLAANAEQKAQEAQNENQPLPKGVVIGPDGKPCKTCTSGAAWRSMMKQSTKTPTVTSTPTSTSITSSIRPDCPPDVEQLGRSTWTFLHTLTASYPTQPTPVRQQETKLFISLFSNLYPCWNCAEDFREWLSVKGNEPRVSNREEFGRWMCEAHNEVNRKLGKREFDCGRWEERWRTGWKDGSCD